MVILILADLSQGVFSEIKRAVSKKKKKDGCFIMIKISVHQENIPSLNIHLITEGKCDRTKRTDKYPIIVGDFFVLGYTTCHMGS